LVTALLVQLALSAIGHARPAYAANDDDRTACNRGDDPDACGRIIDDVLALDHDRVAASFKRGLFHRDHGDRDMALTDFQKAISLDPQNHDASLSNRCLAIVTNDDRDRPVFAYAIADSADPAKHTAFKRCEQEAARNSSSPACAVADLSCDGFARLPAALRPELSRPCALGEKVTISGTIQDVARKRGGMVCRDARQGRQLPGIDRPFDRIRRLVRAGRAAPELRQGKAVFGIGYNWLWLPARVLSERAVDQVRMRLLDFEGQGGGAGMAMAIRWAGGLSMTVMLAVTGALCSRAENAELPIPPKQAAKPPHALRRVCVGTDGRAFPWDSANVPFAAVCTFEEPASLPRPSPPK
jgi:hypothetical protein